MVRKIPISKQQHGSIIHDPTGFGIASWSPDESSIVYIAEQPVPLTHAFWESKTTTDNAGSTTAATSIVGGKHILDERYMEE